MRIFVGLTDVANITATYAKGFKALGHEVFSAVWNKSYFFPDAEYDLIIDERQPESKRGNNIVTYLKMAFYLVQLLKSLNCDLFIIYAPAVLPSNLYYPVLKLLGKKIITPFWGSDIRYWYAFAKEMRSFGVQDEMFPFFEYARSRSGGSYWDKQRTVKIAEKYSDLIITQPETGQLLSRPYMRASVPLDLAQYKFNVPSRIKPLILHAPSVPEAKGTDVVINVIKELREEGLEFEFRLIEKMPNTELRELLADSDIVVDELYSATVGGLSSEAMATGNVVLVRYMADYCKVPEGCPAINVNKFTLKDNLRKIILDVDRRKELANLGRPYVENANDHIKICRDLLSWVEQKDTIEYDFYPTFSKDFQIPDQILKDEKKETGKKTRRLLQNSFVHWNNKKEAELIGDFLNASAPQSSKFMQSIKNWRAKLSPVFGVIILGVFFYWIWLYRDIILDTFRKIELVQLVALVALIILSSILTVWALVVLVQDKGYTAFRFADGYHSLNLSQLAAMVPGGIWGYAGFAGFLWSRGISKIDSVVIILLNTIIMLTACAMVGISGLIAILGWGYAAICLLPFLFLIFGRNWLDGIRHKFYPESSRLPSTIALLKSLFLGVLVWIIISSCFAWLLYTGNGAGSIPFWTVVGAYATGYLGGYISILVPSGLGVSEGLVALMLGPFIGTEKILAVAISFRIIHTSIIWFNILLSVIFTTWGARKVNSDNSGKLQ